MLVTKFKICVFFDVLNQYSPYLWLRKWSMEVLLKAKLSFYITAREVNMQGTKAASPLCVRTFDVSFSVPEVFLWMDVRLSSALAYFKC